MRQAARPLLLVLVLLPLLGGGRTHAEVSSEARTPAEVYERRASLADALVFVAGDLKVRAEAQGLLEPATLLLLVDPAPALKDDLEAITRALPALVATGPPSLRIGVQGLQAERTDPSTDPREAEKGLLALTFLPVGGPKNVHAGIREAARTLRHAAGPTALVLVTAAGAEAEDDVERTRDALLDRGVAFYAIAPEAAFERPWARGFPPRNHADSGLTERFDPSPRRLEKGALYYGGDVAYGLLPSPWELDLAQTEFTWVRPPRYPVPSGFGTWSLSTLSYSTGGRYFIHDFSVSAKTRAREKKRAASPAHERAKARRTTLYDYSRLGLFAPDLRPRSRVLKDLSKDHRARTIVRIWEHLADEACPVVGALGTLELSGPTLVSRPARPVRSVHRLLVWYEEMDDVRKAMAHVRRRLDKLDLALRWWGSANGKPRPPTDRPDPLRERVEADFQLLGLLLRQVRFQWLGRLAALKQIKPLHVSFRRVRLRPKVLARGPDAASMTLDVGNRDLNLALAELRLGRLRFDRRYRDTPWALLLSKQRLFRYELDIQVIEEPEDRRPRGRDGDAKDGKKGDPAGAKKPPRKPPSKPPAGPRPGSVSGGPTTEER